MLGFNANINNFYLNQNHGFGNYQNQSSMNINSIFGLLFNNLNYQSKIKVTKPKVKVPKKPKDDEVVIVAKKGPSGLAAIVNKLNNKDSSLGEIIKSFSETDSEINKDFSNDNILEKIYSKMSETDKAKHFNNGEAYIISKRTGEILGVAGNSQISNISNSSATNSSFKVTQDIGLSKTRKFFGSINIPDAKNQEANGGQIELNGKKYNVASSIYLK